MQQSDLLDLPRYAVVLIAKDETGKVSVDAFDVLALTLGAIRALLIAQKRKSARSSVLGWVQATHPCPAYSAQLTGLGWLSRKAHFMQDDLYGKNRVMFSRPLDTGELGFWA